ncbi:MAG: 4Fe-4S binding protein [Caldilineaceae bacterium]|nr:4Fe-4S binding protein [Caldilineaceae bacterium]HRJ41970.1 4Fe-4S binding protein [Caldilineaceae bacterium]
MPTIPLPTIDHTLCTGCRRCVEVCPTQALVQIDEKAYLVYPELCTYCSVCQDVCPENAISLPFLIIFGPSSLPDSPTQPESL